MKLSERTGRIEMHFTLEEMDTLAWLVEEEIIVQKLLAESDGKLLKQLQELYESFTW